MPPVIADFAGWAMNVAKANRGMKGDALRDTRDLIREGKFPLDLSGQNCRENIKQIVIMLRDCNACDEAEKQMRKLLRHYARYRTRLGDTSLSPSDINEVFKECGFSSS